MLRSRSTQTQLKKLEKESDDVQLLSALELERLLVNEFRKSVTSHVRTVYNWRSRTGYREDQL
jgi:hypothetical protein